MVITYGFDYDPVVQKMMLEHFYLEHVLEKVFRSIFMFIHGKIEWLSPMASL